MLPNICLSCGHAVNLCSDNYVLNACDIQNVTCLSGWAGSFLGGDSHWRDAPLDHDWETETHCPLKTSVSMGRTRFRRLRQVPY